MQSNFVDNFEIAIRIVITTRSLRRDPARSLRRCSWLRARSPTPRDRAPRRSRRAMLARKLAPLPHFLQLARKSPPLLLQLQHTGRRVVELAPLL